MKHRLKKGLLCTVTLALLLCLGFSTALGETLVLQGDLPKVSKMCYWDGGTKLERVRSPWLYDLEHRLPDLTLTFSDAEIPTREKLLAKGIKGDAALLRGMIGLETLWASSQLADLTQTGAANLLKDVHPRVLDMVTQEGKVFGIPVGIAPYEALTVSCEGLEAAGLTREELPTTFPALLDFLDRWDASSGVLPLEGVNGSEEAALFLGKLVVTTYRLTEAESGRPTDWASEEMTALFGRCREVGKKLGKQKAEKGATALFALTSGDPQQLPYALPLRLREDAPGLVPVSVDVLVLRSDVQAREAAETFLMCYAQRIAVRPEEPYTPYTFSQWEHDADVAHALLYASADQEVLCDSPFSYPAVANAIAYLELMLENSALPEENHEQIREALPFLRDVLPGLEAKHIYISTEALAVYQQLAPCLCDGGEAVLSADVSKEIKHWAQGKTSDSQLGKKLQMMFGKEDAK